MKERKIHPMSDFDKISEHTRKHGLWKIVEYDLTEDHELINPVVISNELPYWIAEQQWNDWHREQVQKSIIK